MKNILPILTVCLIGILSLSLHSCRFVEIVPIAYPDVYFEPGYPVFNSHNPRLTLRSKNSKRSKALHRRTPPPPERRRVR